MANCLNCESPLSAGQKFCAACGQKAGTGRLTFHDIWHDAVHYVTHADKGIFHLIKVLAVKPGTVAREYVDGRRKAYFKPFNFLLIVASLVVFMTSTLSSPQREPVKRLEQAAQQARHPEQKKYLQAMAVRAAHVSNFTVKYSNVINLLATPLFAGLIWLFYARARYSYLEHLVANMYFVPFIMLYFALLIVPLQHWMRASGFSLIIMGMFFLFEFLYRGIAYYQFMHKKGVWHLLKALGVSLLCSGIWFGASYFAISYYIRHGY